MDHVNLEAWQGRTETQPGLISIALAGKIHATLVGQDAPPPQVGDEIPRLWHWCAFPPVVPMEALARDGHPKLGDFLPPVPLERRMWASGSLIFHAPLRVGQPFDRLSRIASVQEKEGKTGRMVFVTVDHQIKTNSRLAIEERQDIVYLDIPDAFRPPAKQPMPPSAESQSPVALSAALLFRYSAITFNAHRIHYDLPYAQEMEHYPGLVVHGPLQAKMLMAVATAHRGRAPDRFRFRGVHPMLLDPRVEQVADIALETGDAGEINLFTGQDGHQCMKATAEWEDKS